MQAGLLGGDALSGDGDRLVCWAFCAAPSSENVSGVAAVGKATKKLTPMEPSRAVGVWSRCGQCEPSAFARKAPNGLWCAVGRVAIPSPPTI